MVVQGQSIVAAADAKARLSEMLDRVERGEEITITRHGESVARLVPMAKHDPQRAKDAIDRWLSNPNRPTLGGLSWKELRDEGRKY